MKGAARRAVLLLATVVAIPAVGIGGSVGCGEAEREGLRADTLPTPVLLVPGWGDQAGDLAPLRGRFLGSGWTGDRVLALEFQDPVGSNREHAAAVGRAVDSLRARTGSASVDVVAHSMGGLAVRRHLVERSGEGIRSVVFLGTPHRGTVAAHLAWGTGGREMEPGSSFLDSLNARPPVPDGVRALTVRTPLDLRILPGESVTLPPAGNIRNVEVCCPTHAGMLDDPETFRVVREFLEAESDPS